MPPMSIPPQGRRSTWHAPARRGGEASVRRQAELLGEEGAPIEQLFDTVGEAVFVLNEHRQIVFCNRAAADLVGVADRRSVYGLRPGEAVGCLRACDMPAGCGTSQYCRVCGAVNAILASAHGPDERDCRILRAGEGDALDLRVRASPLTMRGQSFTVFSAIDVSHEKRRRALERVFLHDVGNTVAGLKMLAARLEAGDDEGRRVLYACIREGIDRLEREAAAQRELLQAESGELRVRPENLSGREVVESVISLFAGPAGGEAAGRLRVGDRCRNPRLRTDRTILSRVLDNMVRNAVEATGPGQLVTVWCEPCEGGVRFHVHNPGCMPSDVQAQVFQRSFSTKGESRGLGTYSMRLLTVRYLKGRVSFTSTEEAGTTFTVTLPPALPVAIPEEQCRERPS